MIVGIDLGTTFSLVAFMSEEGPRVIPDATGERLLPSVVAEDASGRVLVGRPARERLSYAPASGAARFKLDMGTRATRRIGAEDLSAPVLSSLVLRELRVQAEQALGMAVVDAVITVPAYFRESQRAATAEAGRLAGFTVRRIINEPTAAAIAYGFHESQEERRVLVADLGGGTFDVSILEVFEGMAEVQATAGDTRLGGEDFTDNLAAAVLQAIGLRNLQQTSPSAFATFRQACEVAKCTLTSTREVHIPLVALPGAASSLGSFLVSRPYFDSLHASQLTRMRACVVDALRQAGASPGNIDEVILVGGASRMPCVAALLGELMDRPPQCRLDPDLVVALGAAVQAALIEGRTSVGDFVVTDITPFSLGVRVHREHEGVHGDRYFNPIIHRGETIPISRQEAFFTVHPEQTQVHIEIYQGDHRFIDDNELIGEVTVDCPPLSDAPGENRQIDVRFTQDLNGLLEVEATVTATGVRAQVVIEGGSGHLGEEERRRAIDALQRLKVHPRELLPNRYLLEQANHLYATLPRLKREALDEVLIAFESALELQDSTLIKERRARVEETMRSLAQP